MTGATAPAPVAGDPTLLQLARGGSRWAWAGFVVLAIAALVALLAVTVLRPGKPKGGGASVTIPSTAARPGVKLSYARGELKIASNAGGSLLLNDRGSDPQGSRLYLTPLTLAAYEGSPTGALPLASVAAQRTIAARFDAGATRFIDEGLVNIGPNPGYQLSYVTKRDGATWYGRAAVVVPDVDGERGAVLMDGEEQRTATGKIVGPRAVGRVGDLRLPMRSLVFVK